MDIILANSQFEELGFVSRFDMFDCEVSNEASVESNSFELTMPVDAWREHRPSIGYAVYVPGTEYGGLIDAVDKRGRTVSLRGATWEGMLARQMAWNRITPRPPELVPLESGEVGYSGVARLLLESLIKGDIHVVEYVLPNEDMYVSARYRYKTVLAVIKKTLAVEGDRGARLNVEFKDRKAHLRVVGGRDMTSTVSLEDDYGATVDIAASDEETYNHIHALGGGEGTARLRIDVWRTSDGGATNRMNHPLRLSDDRTYIYDYNNISDYEELLALAKKKLQELGRMHSVRLNIPPSNLKLELCDRVMALDRDTGVEIEAVIDKKILRLTPNGTRMEYQANARSPIVYFDGAHG